MLMLVRVRRIVQITRIIFCQFTTRLYKTYLDVLPVYFPNTASNNAEKK